MCCLGFVMGVESSDLLWPFEQEQRPVFFLPDFDLD